MWRQIVYSTQKQMAFKLKHHTLPLSPLLLTLLYIYICTHVRESVRGESVRKIDKSVSEKEERDSHIMLTFLEMFTVIHHSSKFIWSRNFESISLWVNACQRSGHRLKWTKPA